MLVLLNRSTLLISPETLTQNPLEDLAGAAVGAHVKT
jgi:hypothetical protein